MKTLDHELRDLLIEVASLGASKALVEVGKLRPYLTRAEASRAYGKRTVERWINRGLITVRHDESATKWRIDRNEIQAVAASQSIANYINQKK